MPVHPNTLKNLQPEKYQFTSTNRPVGGRLGHPNRSTIFKRWMGTRTTTMDINGNEVKLTVEDAIVIAQAKKAINGDTAAANFMFEGKYGKVKDIAVEGAGVAQIDYSRFTPEQLVKLKEAQQIMANALNEQRNAGVDDAEIVEEE